MKLLFIKSDLQAVPRWTDNIKDEWINPFIFQTCETQFRDTISATLYDAMASTVAPILAGTQGNEWSSVTSYASGFIVQYNGVFYVSLASIIPSQPNPSLNANWRIYELVNFWANYVKPYLVYSCYKSFLIWHGKHIAQGGFRKHVDNTSSEINADELGYLLGDTRNTIDIKLTKLNNLLNDVSYTFDGVVYVSNSNIKQNRNTGFNIFSV